MQRMGSRGPPKLMSCRVRVPHPRHTLGLRSTAAPRPGPHDAPVHPVCRGPHLTVSQRRPLLGLDQVPVLVDDKQPRGAQHRGRCDARDLRGGGGHTPQAGRTLGGLAIALSGPRAARLTCCCRPRSPLPGGMRPHTRTGANAKHLGAALAIALPGPAQRADMLLRPRSPLPGGMRPHTRTGANAKHLGAQVVGLCARECRVARHLLERSRRAVGRRDVTHRESFSRAQPCRGLLSVVAARASPPGW